MGYFYGGILIGPALAPLFGGEFRRINFSVCSDGSSQVL